jgi:hypothetical protein
MSTVITKEFSAPTVNRREILRYMGCRGNNTEIDALVERALLICGDKFTYKVCFAEYDLKIENSVCDFGFARVESKDLAKCLEGCEKAVVFGATVGLELDRLVLRYGKSEPSLAVCFQSIGAERTEALCDAF